MVLSVQKFVTYPWFSSLLGSSPVRQWTQPRGGGDEGGRINDASMAGAGGGGADADADAHALAHPRVVCP